MVPLDYLDLNVGVVLLAERSDEQLGPERRAKVLLKKLPRVGRAEPSEVRVRDLPAVSAQSHALS